MLKHLFTSGAASVLVLTAGLLAPAQAQQPTPSAPQTTPQAQPRPAAPAPTTPQTQISEADLQKFASALEEVYTLQTQARERMVQVIEQQGLTQERYSQIAQSRQEEGAATAQPTPGISAAEMRQYEQVTSQLQQIHQSAQGQMAQAVEAAGLNVQQFDQILVAVRQNPQLQQRVLNLLQSPQSGS